MFENFRKFREVKQRARSAARPEYDSDGRELLRMTVKSDDEFVSPYSIRGYSVLSEEVNGFLDTVAAHMPLKNDLHIEISGDTIDSGEREEYAAAVKNSYRVKALESDRRLKRNAALALVMALLAAAILALYVCLELYSAGYVLLELIDITAWVFMWEAVDLFFLQRPVLKAEQIRAYRLFDAEISFVGNAADEYAG